MTKKDWESPKMQEYLWNLSAKNTELIFGEKHDSICGRFYRELRSMGYEFEVVDQMLNYMKINAAEIIPIAFRYYKEAIDQCSVGDGGELLKYFLDRKYTKIIKSYFPEFIQMFYKCSGNSRDVKSLRWQIANIFYRHKPIELVNEYLAIIQNREFGTSRQLFVLIVGEKKIESAIPILVNLLEDEEVRLHAICALGCFKREEFRPYFERFKDCKHPGWRKYSREAIKKLDKYNEKMKEKNK